jgi:hypothetical protein
VLKTAAPEGLQLDLLSALVRLEQVQAELKPDADVPFVLGRVFECDVPRLWAYISVRTLGWMAAQDLDTDRETQLGVARIETMLRSRAVVWLGHAVAFAAGCVITAYFMSPPW